MTKEEQNQEEVYYKFGPDEFHSEGWACRGWSHNAGVDFLTDLFTDDLMLSSTCNVLGQGLHRS